MFILHKDGSAMERIVPDDERLCTGREFAALVAKTGLTKKEATAWRRDLHAARKMLKAPRLIGVEPK